MVDQNLTIFFCVHNFIQFWKILRTITQDYFNKVKEAKYFLKRGVAEDFCTVL